MFNRLTVKTEKDNFFSSTDTSIAYTSKGQQKYCMPNFVTNIIILQSLKPIKKHFTDEIKIFHWTDFTC